ncbi:hypothetical protein D9M68_652550 [compost metagenome]
MIVRQRGQALEQDIAVQHVGVGEQPVLRHSQVELQAVAMIRIDLVVAVQVGITDAGHQQGTQPRVIAKFVLLALPFQRNHPLPAAVQLAVPFRAESEQTAEAIGVGQVFVLITAGIAQLVGQRRIERHVVPQANVLPWRRQLHLGAITVALRVGPVTRPVGPATRPDVGGKTQPEPHAPGLAHLQLDLDRYQLLLRLGRVGVDPYRLEIAAGAQRLVQLGDPLGVVRAVRGERHHALQQRLVERCIALKTHRAQLVTRAAVVDQLDIGNPGTRIDAQALASEIPAEKPIARGLVLDMPFGRVVAAVVEHRTAS